MLGANQIPRGRHGSSASLRSSCRKHLRFDGFIGPHQLHTPLKDGWLIEGLRSKAAYEVRRTLKPTVPVATSCSRYVCKAERDRRMGLVRASNTFRQMSRGRCNGTKSGPGCPRCARKISGHHELGWLR
eukprot:scaffold45752_cov35-Tisochrysis_lutea.AAC.3